GAGVGYEVSNVNREAGTADFTIYGEANALLAANANLPVVGNILRWVPNVDGGMGVRLKWTVKGIDDTPTASDRPRVSYYLKTGDTDSFDGGGATDIDFELNDPTAVTSYQEFLDNLVTTTIQRRFVITGTMGRKYNLSRRFQNQFQSKLGQEQKDLGLDVSGFVEFLAVLPDDAVKELFTHLVTLLHDPREAIETLENVLAGGAMDGGTAIEEIYNIIVDHLKWAKVR